MLVAVIALVGCQGGAGAPDRQGASGGVAAKGEAVRIGLVPSGPEEKVLAASKPLGDYLTRKMDVRVELVPMKTYEDMVEALEVGEADAGIAGSLVAYRAMRDLGAIPLARPEKGGISTYEGVILVRKDSGIRNARGLRSKKFSMVKGTSAGELFPVFLVLEMGSTPDKYFETVVLAPNHEDSIGKVLDGSVDGAATKSTKWTSFERDRPAEARDLVVIASSDARFPDNTVIASKRMDAKRRESLKAALLGAKSDQEAAGALDAFGAEGFISTSEADLAGVKRMADETGL
jgi:phosphate/phosphite/phosphonate ABC transporter binding protein